MEESIVARKRSKKVYTYNCSLTDQTFKMTAEAANPEELVSVKAWYELNPDKDDRPEVIKKQLILENDEQL